MRRASGQRLLPFLLLLALLACPASDALAAPAKFLGPNKCTSCHDHEKQAAWYPKDTHSKALTQLEDKNAAKYAKAIGLADPYDLKGSCVGCHATVFNGDANAGVSCETCHGAGSDYVEPHQQKGSYAKAITLGMFDTRGNLQVWAKMCVDCHIMRDPKLIASGHKSGADFDAGAGSQKIVHWAPPYDFAKISALAKAGGGKPAGAAAAPAAAPAAAAPPAPKPTAAPAPAAVPAPAPTAKPAPAAVEPPAAAKPVQPSPVPMKPTAVAPAPEEKKPTSPPAPPPATAVPPPPPTAAPPPPPTAAVAAPAAVAKAPSPTSEILITIEATPIPTRAAAPRHADVPPAVAPRAAEPAPAASVEPSAPAAPAPSAPKPSPTRRPYKKKVLTHVTPQAQTPAESQPTSQPAPTVTPTRRPASQAPPVRAPH